MKRFHLNWKNQKKFSNTSILGHFNNLDYQEHFINSETKFVIFLHINAIKPIIVNYHHVDVFQGYRLNI